MKRSKVLFFLVIIFISLTYGDVILVCKPDVDSIYLGKKADIIGRLLVVSVQSKFNGNVLYSDNVCLDKECAIKVGTENNATEVIFSSVLKLGEKLIFTASIVKNDGSDIFFQKLTTSKIEDFEELCDRMADALLNRKSVEMATSVENVTEKESEVEVRKGRLTYHSWGFNVGTGYPLIGKNSFRYDNSIERRPLLFKLGWTNFWEFKYNFGLDLEFLCFLPASLGGDASLLYFFNKSDFSPFAGGGVGIHFLPDKRVNYIENTQNIQDKRYWGPSLNIQGGLMLFRTYNIHLISRAQYHVIFTDDIDNCISGDITFLIESKKRDKVEKIGFWSVVRDYIVYTTLATIVVTVAGSIAGSL